MTREQQYLIYLINCAVKGERAEHPDYDLDWTAFSAYIEEQQFEQIMYPLFKNNKPDMDPKVWHHLHQRYGRAVVRDTTQDMELAEICEALSDAGIEHIPLKGSVIKKYYPLPDIRYSGDFDILVHEGDMKKAGKVLTESGFTAEKTDLGIHDIFRRDKTEIELHKQLVQTDNPSHNFCSKVWDHAHKEDGFTYAMSNEFFYVYMLAHLRKHLLLSGGAGIKLILDIYVMRNCMELDHQKLEEYCRLAKMEYFDQCMVSLEKKWFEGTYCDEKDVLLTEEIILNSGAYSDYDNYLSMLLSEEDDVAFEQNKMKKFIVYLFPPVKVLKSKYKILEKHPYLLPAMWVRRFVTTNREKAATLLSSFKTLDKDRAVRMNRYRADMWK